jgi:lipoprotein-anchoring transpeptidase ErfK/SrfK
VKVPRGVWSIVVDKSLFKLWVCYEGAPVKPYAVTLGAESKPTPAAKYAVGVRNPKPPWWPPAETNIKDKPVKYGDPRNPLGEWWIALDHDMHHGIGIHGTNDPRSIGTRASNGCVRMLNEDVREVFAFCPRGTRVIIR